jgi:hypothetical protein
MLIGSGLQALTTLGKFKPAVLGEIQAAGDSQRLHLLGGELLPSRGEVLERAFDADVIWEKTPSGSSTGI